MKHSEAVLKAAREVMASVTAMLHGDETEESVKIPAEQIMAEIITRHLAQERREVAEVLRDLNYLLHRGPKRYPGENLSVIKRAGALLAKIAAQLKGE